MNQNGEIKPRVKTSDIELVLEHYTTEMVTEGNDAMVGGGVPDTETLVRIKAARRIKGAVKRSLTGKRSYRKALEGGYKPQTFHAVESLRPNLKWCLECEDVSPRRGGRCPHGEDVHRRLFVLATAEDMA